MNVQDMLQTLDGYFRSNQVDKIEPFLLDHLRQALAGQDYSAVLTILNELMGFYRGMSRFDEAIEAAQRALDLLDQLGYKGTIPYATTLLNAATAYRADGQNQRAIAAYEEVGDIYKDKQVSDPYLVASLHNNMSLAYQEMGEHDKAIEHLQQALPIVQSISGGEAEVAVTLTNLALSQMKSGRMAEVRENLLEAVRLFESQDNVNPHYGAALAALGEVAFHQGNGQDAIGYYERALAAVEAHYGKNLYYAFTLESLAVVYEGIDKDKSDELRREAKALQLSMRPSA